MGALQMGLKEEELPEIIDSWREANPKIVQYWWDTEKAAMTAYKTGERQEVGKIAFEFYSGTLWMVLPSGRRLAYLKPRQQPNRFGRMSLTYEGMGQNHKWSRQETYSGRLVENATQAIARDILAESMDRISAEDLNIVAHVHDEVSPSSTGRRRMCGRQTENSSGTIMYCMTCIIVPESIWNVNG